MRDVATALSRPEYVEGVPCSERIEVVRFFGHAWPAPVSPAQSYAGSPRSPRPLVTAGYERFNLQLNGSALGYVELTARFQLRPSGCAGRSCSRAQRTQRF